MRETNLSIWKVVIFHAVLQELSLEIYNLWIGYQSLLGFSFKDTDNSQDSRVREATMFYSSLPFYPLTNIQTFTCYFAYEMITTYF